jgi:SAM-dependent methyltransferase
VTATDRVPERRTAARFRKAYADLREREGRGGESELLILPYLRHGRWAAQWRVRSRTYEAFMSRIVGPLERSGARALRVLDLGAGNGWLSYRLLERGHRPVAVDWRDDDVDGLGAARGYAKHVGRMFERVAASFEALPFDDRSFDLAVFNASLHYTTELHGTLREAVRVLGERGVIAILDSPFYRREQDGEAMVAEKRSGAALAMGELQEDLLALPSIEYLTRERLVDASGGLGLSWRRLRVVYPLAYELRPLWARLRGRRTPSRFDVWEGRV